MNSWITKLILKWLLSNLTEKKVKEWADQAKALVVPWLRTAGDTVIVKLREAANESENTIDDVAVDALEAFWDALLPDTTSTI